MQRIRAGDHLSLLPHRCNTNVVSLNLRYAFAKSGTLTPEEARAETRLLAEAGNGGDPSVVRHKARKALTVAELRDRRLVIFELLAKSW